MSRPTCVVRADEFEGEERPRFLHGGGVKSRVWNLGKRVGLVQMGVSMRSVEPSCKSTHRHFHTVEEEWVWVLSGTGVVRIGPHELPVREGSFVGFPPGPRPHHLIAAGSKALEFLEGGERRREEDTGFYVDRGRTWGPDGFADTNEVPPLEEGDASQCLHVDDLTPAFFHHEVDAMAIRQFVELHGPTGLERQAVNWVRVAAGCRSTARHMHDRTDEWIYVLEGRARARVGDDRFEVSAGDFLGHPAGGAAHVMEASTEFTYLMGGQIDPEDIVVYPDAGVERRSGEVVPAGS